jgi:hypothetical protein
MFEFQTENLQSYLMPVRFQIWDVRLSSSNRVAKIMANKMCKPITFATKLFSSRPMRFYPAMKLTKNEKFKNSILEVTIL